MNDWTLHFEPPDLAGWVWLAVAAAAAAELIRYVLVGHRPGAAAGRFGVAIGIATVVGIGRVTGLAAPLRCGHGTAVVLLGLFSLVWFGRAYARTTRNLPARSRLGLLAVRMAAVAVLLALLSRPILQHVSISHERAVLAILLDDSKSMQVRDVVADGDAAEPSSAAARIAAVRKALSNSAAALAALNEGVDLRWFTFDGALRSATGPQLAGNGEQTALAGAVEHVRDLLSQAGGGKPAGVIVISDGRDNLSSDDERRAAGDWLADAGVPLYTVGVGSETPLGGARSLLARRLDCPPSVAVLNRLPVRTELFATGLAGRNITVELWLDDDIVDARQVAPEQAQELLRVELACTPVAGGLHRVAVRARASGVNGPEGEAELSQFVRVTDDKIQVLYIDRPRYERAAIARALEAAKELRVTKVDLTRAADLAQSALPQSTGEWRAYHVILIGDVDCGAFPPAALQAIRGLALEQGRGVAMLGGARTLGSGQYGRSPLTDVLPVNLATVGQLEPPVKFELTPAGQLHAICRLGADATASAAVWKQLPPFDGAGRLSGLKATAETLLRTPEGAPLLVVSETGKGRTAAVAFDSTWRWSFGDDKGADAQRRFWRQLVLWLANRRPEVWVASDRPRYDLVRLRSQVDKITLRAGVTDPTTGRTPDRAKLTGTLTGPDGLPHELHWVQTGEAFEARPVLSAPGEYRVKVVAASGDQQWGDSQTAFIIAAADPELADPTADLENLRLLAARTRGYGGEYVPLAQFASLLERFAAKPHAAEIRHLRRRSIVDDWPWEWFAAFVGLLAVEWIARRRAGLV